VSDVTIISKNTIFVTSRKKLYTCSLCETWHLGHDCRSSKKMRFCNRQRTKYSVQTSKSWRSWP